MDTQVLGCVLAAAVGKPLTEYLEEKLWKRMGTEGDVRWMMDNERDQMGAHFLHFLLKSPLIYVWVFYNEMHFKWLELAFGTLNARTRDYARFGWLYLNKGRSPLDGARKFHAQSTGTVACYLRPSLITGCL